MTRSLEMFLRESGRVVGDYGLTVNVELRDDYLADRGQGN
jgi:hypothetical protein